MKSSNKLLIVLTAATALSVYIGANFAYAASSGKSDGLESTISGNGQLVSQVKAVTAFSGIHVSGLANVIVEKGNVNQVNVSADQNLFPYIKITVKNDQLYIGGKKNVTLNPSQMMNIIITSKDTHFSQLSTSGKIIFAEKNMNTNKLNVETSGKTKMNLSGHVSEMNLHIAGKSDVTLCDMNSKAIHFDTAGESDIHLCGHANDLTVKSAGKSTLDAKNFTTDNLSVLGAGKVDITSHVSKSIHVSAFGKVTINYYGNPKTINKAVFGDIILKKMDA